jgi:hypothetical protein
MVARARLINQLVPFRASAALIAAASTRTTQLYDRRRDEAFGGPSCVGESGQ